MTGELVRLGLFYLLLTAVGWTLLRALNVVSRRPGVAEIGCSFLAGWAAVGVSVTFLAVAGAPVGIPVLVAIAAALGGALWLARDALRHRLGVPLEPLRPSDWKELAVTVTARVIVATFLLRAAGEALRDGDAGTWDAWVFWLAKARAIYYFGGLDAGPGGVTSYANHEYPPLQPLMEAITFHVLDSSSATLVHVNHVALAAGFFAGAVVLLRHRVRPLLLWPSLALLTTAVGFTRWLGSGLADPAVSYFVALAGVSGVLWILERRPAWLVLGGLLAAAAALTKSEGLVLALPLGLILVLVGLVEGRPWRGPAAVAAAPLVAVTPWNLWLFSHDQRLGSVNYSWGDLVDPERTVAHLDRLDYAVGEMTQILFGPREWVFFVPLALAASVMLARHHRTVTLTIVGWLSVTFLGLAAVYWISWRAVDWYIATSADRTLMSLGTYCGAILPLLLSEVFRSRASPTRPPQRIDAA